MRDITEEQALTVAMRRAIRMGVPWDDLNDRGQQRMIDAARNDMRAAFGLEQDTDR